MKESYKSTLLFWFVFLFFVIIDQLSKWWAKFSLVSPKIIIPSMLQFLYVENTGASFGMLQNNNALLMWFSVIIIGFIVYEFSSLPDHFLLKGGMTLILAGAVGNLLDRAIRGFVIDFIDISIWPTFNIADSCITVGAGCAVWYYLVIDGKSGKIVGNKLKKESPKK